MAVVEGLEETTKQLLKAAHRAGAYRDRVAEDELSQLWYLDFALRITEGSRGYLGYTDELHILCKSKRGQKIIENAFAKAGVSYTALEPSPSAYYDSPENLAKIHVIDAHSPDLLKKLNVAKSCVADAALEAKWDDIAEDIAQTLVGAFTNYKAGNNPKVMASYLLKLTPEVIDTLKWQVSVRLKDDFDVREESHGVRSPAEIRDTTIDHAVSEASRQVSSIFERQRQRGAYCPLPIPDGKRIERVCESMGEKLRERVKSDTEEFKKRYRSYPEPSDRNGNTKSR